MKIGLEARKFFKKNEPFSPHLSLVYGNFPENLRQEIVTKVLPEIPLEFRVEGVDFYDTTYTPEEWSPLGSFRLDL